MSDWRYRLAEQRGTLLALGIFILMFAIYLFNHPAIAGNGFTATAVGNVVQTAANKGVLLALVAMAQTLVVITAGIDLSVGMICVLANCVASYIVVGSFGMALLGCVGVLVDRTGLRRASTASSSSTADCSRSSRRSPPARSTTASRFTCGRSRRAPRTSIPISPT